MLCRSLLSDQQFFTRACWFQMLSEVSVPALKVHTEHFYMTIATLAYGCRNFIQYGRCPRHKSMEMVSDPFIGYAIIDTYELHSGFFISR